MEASFYAMGMEHKFPLRIVKVNISPADSETLWQNKEEKTNLALS